MDLLEREGPLAVLESDLDEAASGRGRMVLVAGEAGIGKSSVAREFTARHGGDAHVWWGACDALSTPRPLGPLHDIARVAGGELAALMTRDAARYDRFSGFSTHWCRRCVRWWWSSRTCTGRMRRPVTC